MEAKINVKVEPAVLRAHAAKVADISDGVASAKSASAATDLGGGAFGILCSFMVPPLSAVKTVADLAIDAAAGAVEKTVGDLKAVADSYEGADAVNSQTINQITTLMGGR